MKIIDSWLEQDKDKPQTGIPLKPNPGGEAEVDWGSCTALIEGIKRKRPYSSAGI